jgi:nitrite reductase/ring-hydroxylating ferredoxin subunit
VGDRIVCAAHGALFDITNGLCTLGPCLGDALVPVPLTVQANGEIHIAPTNHKETNP